MTTLMKRQLAALVDYYRGWGLALRITSTDRTFAEQDKLYAQGKTKLRGGQSLHNYGMAADLVPGNPWPPGVSRAESFQHISKAASLLGFQAVIESDHVHIELDPRQ